jgi:hypothetical protein
MPNGHGGVPYICGPILFAIMFAIFAWLPFGDGGWFAWTRVVVQMHKASYHGVGWKWINPGLPVW